MYINVATLVFTIFPTFLKIFTKKIDILYKIFKIIDMDEKLRKKCFIEKCKNVATSRGTNKRGKHKYGKFCSTHKKRKTGYCRESILAVKCSICNWDGPCDRHRILHGSEGGRYTKGNVMILCPNCHRLLHLGKLSLK